MSHVAIIGAGLGGLSAAAHIVADGHDVTLYERASVPGGRAARTSVETDNGTYTMECGPTVFTMLDIARQPFEALQKNMDELCPMLEVNPAYHAHFADGTDIAWPHKAQDIFDVVKGFAGEKQAHGFKSYEQWLTKLNDVEYTNFIARNFTRSTDLLGSIGPLVSLLKMGAFRSMDSKVRSFLKDDRLAALSTFQSLYAGVTPQQARAIYSIISYMDLVQGVYFPRGGMSSYGEVLCGELSSAGVKVHFNEPVTHVETLDGRVKITSENGTEMYDSIVCNADLPFAYPEIFNREMPRSVKNARYSPSCMLYVVAGTAQYDKPLAHHNIYFASDTKKNFQHLIEGKELVDDPSFLVSHPTSTDPSLAPHGRDVFYVLEPSPHLGSDIDYSSRKDELQQRMRNHLTHMNVSLTEVDHEIYIDPESWQQQGMYQGTPFSLAHTFFQSGPFRPKNFLTSMPGVFLCGTGTTPGVGIPMVIESGRLASIRVKDYVQS